MQKIPEAKITLIFGQRGCGKTTLAKKLIRDCPRLIIYDTLGGEYVDCGLTVNSISELGDILNRANDKFRLVYQPLNPLDEFGFVCRLVCSLENCVLLVEEVDTFLPSNPGAEDYEIMYLIQRGRHHGVSMIGVTQRPYAIPPLLRSQAKVFFSFRQHETRDIDWMKSVYGVAAIQLRELADYEYMTITGGKIERVEGNTNKGRKNDDFNRRTKTPQRELNINETVGNTS